MRLIDADAFIEYFKENYELEVTDEDTGETTEYDRWISSVDVIDDIESFTPYTTEAEIRAKAISDFLKALEEITQKNWIDHLEYGITWADLEEVAEQLKEE